MSEEIKKKRTGNTNCCVVGCHNSYGNSSGIKLYRFPNREWEKERKEKWLNAIKRVHENKKPWTPKPFSRVCSAHFVGGEKSENPLSPSFIPSIFPSIYKKQPKKSELMSGRFQRIQNRRENKTKQEMEMRHDNEVKHRHMVMELADSNSQVEETMISVVENRTVDFGCQVVPLFGEMEDESNTFIFECVHEEYNCASTQATLPKQSSFQSFRFTSESETQTSGDNMVLGFNTLTSEQQLLEVAGVTFSVFHILLKILEVAPNCKLSKENMLFLFLMKLKLGLPFTALAYFFNVHRTTCSRVFVRILHVLSIKTTNFIFWPSKSSVQLLLPEAFRRHYPNSRVIIDCTEVKTEEPPRADQRIYLYSSYKHAYTIKFLVGITPNGFVSFLSDCYGGRSSDAFIVNDSKFLDLLEPGDEVLADKGFPKIITDSHAITVIPPMLHSGRFSEEEVELTYNIASVRIHVERAIQRIKIYNILQKIPTDLLGHVDDIVRMCAVLSNMQSPIIKNKDESMGGDGDEDKDKGRDQDKENDKDVDQDEDDDILT